MLTLRSLDQVKSIAFTPDNKFFVSGSIDTNICIFDIEKDEKVDTIQDAHRGKKGFFLLEFSIS